MLFSETKVETASYRISEPVPIADKRSASPDLAVDSIGKPWMTWVQATDEGEWIIAKCVGDESAIALPVSEAAGIALQPCIISLGHGSLRVFWVSHNGDSWQLLTRIINGTELSSVATVWENADGLFAPRAEVDSNGHCYVVCETVNGNNTSLGIFRQSLNTWTAVDFTPFEGDTYRPQICRGPEQRLWISYDNYSDGAYRIALQAITGDDLESESQKLIVVEDGYQNVHSSLTTDADGSLWIAYASNRNAARRDPAWLTKWSYLCHYDGTNLTFPADDRPGIDIYQEDAFQGWEFPCVAVSHGHAFLVGQSAHSLLFQSLSGSSWSPVANLDNPRWGSWKPRCRMAGIDTIHIASMGLCGVQIQQLEFTDLADARPVFVRVQRSAAAPAKAQSAHPKSDAAITDTNGTSYNIYFGDLHAHSAYSDAVGEVDELYHRYRDWYGYDFAALTDHDYLDGIELSGSELKMIWNHAQRFTRADEFLAWYAYEWTSPAISVHAGEGDSVGEGHRHVLYLDDSGPLVSYSNEDSNTGAKLLAKLAGRRALVIPHHTSWSGTDWDAHDPELHRVVEMVSTHGRFEFGGNKPIGYRRDHVHENKFVLDALGRGYKLGFVGGSDSHGLRWHAIELDGRADHIEEGTRVGWKEDAYRTGMTAILAESLNREQLFEALYHRRCYATSGVRIVLDFRVDDHLMGSEISIRSAPTLSVHVQGTAGLRAIEIVRDGQVFGGVNFHHGESIATSSFEMSDSLLIPGESVYYYCRVIQEDGNMAWSSPIWVTHVE